jgi:hypothetical protein
MQAGQLVASAEREFARQRLLGSESNSMYKMCTCILVVEVYGNR